MPPHCQPRAMTSQILKPRATIVKPKPVVPRLRPQPLADTTAVMPVLDLRAAATLQRTDGGATKMQAADVDTSKMQAAENFLAKIPKITAGIPEIDRSAHACSDAQTMQRMHLNNTMLQGLRL